MLKYSKELHEQVQKQNTVWLELNIDERTLSKNETFSSLVSFFALSSHEN